MTETLSPWRLSTADMEEIREAFRDIERTPLRDLYPIASDEPLWCTPFGWALKRDGRWIDVDVRTR